MEFQILKHGNTVQILFTKEKVDKSHYSHNHDTMNSLYLIHINVVCDYLRGFKCMCSRYFKILASVNIRGHLQEINI